MDLRHTLRIFSLVFMAGPLLAEVVPPTEVSIISLETDVAFGDSFSFTCHLKHLQSGLNFLRIYNYPKDGEPGYLLATNANLEDEMKTVARYGVTANFQDDGSLDITFTSSAAQYADSGTYSCALVGNNGILQEVKSTIMVHDQQAFMMEMIVVPPAGVDDEYRYSTLEPEDHVFELDDTTRFEIRITSSPTNPAPVMTMFVGSQEITADFNIETHEVVTEGDHPKLKAYAYGMVAHAFLDVDHSYTEGFTVRVKSGDVEESLDFDVEFSGFPPHVEEGLCPPSVVARLHQSDLELSCTFASSDLPEMYFYYKRVLASGGVEDEVFYPGNEDQQYKVTLYESPANMTYTMMVNIDTVFPQMFRDHFIYISNQMGNMTQKITLERDPSDERDINGASRTLMVSMTTVLLLVAASVFGLRL